jgi:hypothetical protein
MRPHRHEHKYLVPESLLKEIRDFMEPFVELDPYAVVEPPATPGYTVRSIYFDSPAMDAYHEKMAGIRDRKKLRIRAYNLREDDSPAFLEIKRKRNQLIAKNRFAVRYGDIPAALRDPARLREIHLDLGTDALDGERFMYHLLRESMVPVILVIYDREPYRCRFGSTLRVTLDKALRSKPVNSIEALFEDETKRSLEGHFILEVKFLPGRGFPSWIRQMIARHGLIKQALSKYTISIDRHGLAEEGRKGRMGQRTIIAAGKSYA